MLRPDAPADGINIHMTYLANVLDVLRSWPTSLSITLLLKILISLQGVFYCVTQSDDKDMVKIFRKLS